LQRLDGFLRSPGCGGDSMSLSRAHGFLTAALSGPEPISEGEWMRLMFDEPVFADADQAQDIPGAGDATA
jgi:yecA family protein